MKYGRLTSIILIVLVAFIACRRDKIERPNIDPIDIHEIGALPDGNVYSTNTALNQTAAVELGRALFWDPILSGDMDIACATCHHPSYGYADGLARSIGVGGSGLGLSRKGGTMVNRNSPTVINSVFNGINQVGYYDLEAAPMFWDNRVEGAETQALGPIHSLEEMRGYNFSGTEIIPEILNRLNANSWYRNQFPLAFGPDAITEKSVAKAIVEFERTLVANNSPFDLFMRGDQTALNAQQLRGLVAFQRVGCTDCHNGPMLSDFKLHTLGVIEGANVIMDSGAGAFNFRTPSLRNLAYTAPYMHNGALASLDEVLRFYRRNNNRSRNANVSDNELDSNLQNLRNMGPRQQADIIAFLNTMNDDSFDQSIPSSVPSGLYPGGNIEAGR